MPLKRYFKLKSWPPQTRKGGARAGAAEIQLGQEQWHAQRGLGAGGSMTSYGVILHSMMGALIRPPWSLRNCTSTGSRLCYFRLLW
jgi:hypothetical protein